jgi:hypothetical protein
VKPTREDAIKALRVMADALEKGHVDGVVFQWCDSPSCACEQLGSAPSGSEGRDWVNANLPVNFNNRRPS